MNLLDRGGGAAARALLLTADANGSLGRAGTRALVLAIEYHRWAEAWPEFEELYEIAVRKGVVEPLVSPQRRVLRGMHALSTLAIFAALPHALCGARRAHAALVARQHWVT